MSRRTIVAVSIILMVVGVGPAGATEVDPRVPMGTLSEQCERFGCLYSHTPAYYQRDGSQHRPLGIAHELLPDGPGGRRFEQVLWPMVNDSYRADPGRFAAWAGLIECESQWRFTVKNPRSSASGGFQFIRSSWEAVGGLWFASEARYAHPVEQLAMAERLLSIQPNGWSCPGEPSPVVEPWSWR